MEERRSSEGLLSRPVAPWHAYFALRLCPEHLLFISFVLQVVPVSSYIFLSIFVSVSILEKSLLYPGPSCTEKSQPSPSEARQRNRPCLDREDSLFPASVLTHSLSHAHSPSLYLSFLPLHHFITAFAAVLTFPAAQGVCLCPYYANLRGTHRKNDNGKENCQWSMPKTLYNLGISSF